MGWDRAKNYWSFFFLNLFLTSPPFICLQHSAPEFNQRAESQCLLGAEQAGGTVRRIPRSEIKWKTHDLSMFLLLLPRNLTANSISRMLPGAFSGLGELGFLLVNKPLSENKVLSLPFPRRDLSHNLLTTLANDTFIDLTHLVTLYVGATCFSFWFWSTFFYLGILNPTRSPSLRRAHSTVSVTWPF